jgi:hypothetical protein
MERTPRVEGRGALNQRTVFQTGFVAHGSPLPLLPGPTYRGGRGSVGQSQRHPRGQPEQPLLHVVS